MPGNEAWLTISSNVLISHTSDCRTHTLYKHAKLEIYMGLGLFSTQKCSQGSIVLVSDMDYHVCDPF